MIIRVEKCITFGIKKSTTKSTQSKPKLLINTELVSCAEIGDSFRYLGRYFDFDMSKTVHKRELSHTVTDIMSKIDLLPMHPRFKVQLYIHYLLPKISWHLTVVDLTKAWASENLNNLVANYFRSCLDLPISVTFSSTSIITGRDLRPDLFLSLSIKSLYILELTVGYECNLRSNVERMKQNIGKW